MNQAKGSQGGENGSGNQRRPRGEEQTILSDSDFESPAPQRRRVSQRQRERRQRREDQEGHREVESSGTRVEQEKVDERCKSTENSSHLSNLIPTGLEEDGDDEEATGESLLQDSVNPSQDLRSGKMMSKEEITELLQDHSKRVITRGHRKIFISKSDVWTTAFWHFQRDQFVRNHTMLRVSFPRLSNCGSDTGPSPEEFFHLLVKAIFEDSRAFEESPNGFIPRLHTSHMEKGVYRTIGKMISTIMIQGGEPPALLAPCVVDYILTGDVLQVNATPDDVSASELREMLKKVEKSSTDRELENAVKQCDSWRFEVEGLPNPVNMNTKDTFVKKAALFHVILKSQACLDQLIDGLSYYEVLPLFRQNPCMRIFLDLPKMEKEITADDVAGIFKPQFSALGCPRRLNEEMIVIKFQEFLHSVQDKELEEKLSSRTLTKEEKTFLETLRPVHILQFATGKGKLPAFGFNPHPQMIFLDDETTGHPKANTSRNELQICVNCRTLSDSDEFDYFFVEALKNSPVCS